MKTAMKTSRRAAQRLVRHASALVPPMRHALTLSSPPQVRHASTTPKIVWTHTDEAPALASYALLPVVQRFAKAAGVQVETADISVAGRILSLFPEKLKPELRMADELSELGKLATTPEANIIKLPNGARSPRSLGAMLLM